MGEIAKCCPFFQYEKWEKGKTVLKCECMDLAFPSAEARRKFVYPLCASIEGFKECQIYKTLESEVTKNEGKSKS